MKKIIRFLLVHFLFFFCAGVALAQPVMGQQPGAPSDHSGMPNFGDTGVIEGELFTLDSAGKKTPVKQQEVAMLIFNNDQQVLMLKKTSDDQGKFTFKNIFKDPAYAYGFGTQNEDGLFIYPRVSLNAKESTKQIAFQVGENSPYKRDPASMGMPPAGGKESGDSSAGPMNGGAPAPGGMSGRAEHDTSWGRAYQMLALGLSLLVVVLVIVVANNNRRR